MKSLLIGAISLLMVNVCSAHYVNPQCGSNGRFKFLATQFPIGKTCTIKVTSGGAAFDTSFVVTKKDFSFTIPMPNPTQNRRIRISTSEGWSTEVWTTFAKCQALPLKFESFVAEKIDDHRVLLTVTVSDVYDVKELRFTASLDGQNFVVVGTITPDNQNYVKTYTATVDLSKPLNSTK